MNEYLSHSDTLPRIKNIAASSSSQRQSPARQGFQSPRTQSPAPNPQGNPSYAGCVQANGDFRRESRPLTRDTSRWNGRTPSPGPPRPTRQQSPSRDQFQQPRQSFQPRQPVRSFLPRTDFQRPRTPSTDPPVNGRPNFQGQQFQSPGASYNRVPQPDGYRPAAPRPAYGGNREPQSQFSRQPPRSQSIPRRPRGCWTCGRYGCHSNRHSPLPETPAPHINPPSQPSLPSTNPFHTENHVDRYPPPVSPRPESGNGSRTPQLGDRSPIRRQ